MKRGFRNISDSLIYHEDNYSMLQEEVPLSLTTPVLRDVDSLFPGENWFFYWKTSCSLWKAKLESFSGGPRIIVPINWSFHTDDGEHYDFAEKRPETDLAKLVSVAKECHKQIVFVLPLGPAPFLPNGGMPSLLARTLSVGKDGLPYNILDQNGSLSKMYTFFDNRVYKSFRIFAKRLNTYFSSSGIDSDLWGIDCGHVGDDGFQSFFFDRSQVYTQAFSRFLNKKLEEKEVSDISPEQEHKYHVQFFHNLRDLYIQEAEEALASNWEGFFRVGFLGSGNNRFFERVYDRDGLNNYAHEVLECMSLDVLPSSVCLNSQLKKGVLGRMLEELVTKSFSNLKFRAGYYEDEDPTGFNPLSFFEVYDLPEEADPSWANWADLGLWEYLQSQYSWCFSDKGDREYVWNESEYNEEKVLFFHCLGMDDKFFHNILKTFMSGGKVVLNRSGLSKAFVRRLESFFLENELKIEKVNFHTTIHNVILGSGRLIIFEGDQLADLSQGQANQFWERVLSTLEINYLSLPYQKGTYFSWRVRAALHNELSYDEVRRLGVYNPTSYKRKVKFQYPNTFSLIKIIDEVNISIKTTHQEVEIELLPEGSVSFDFGVYVP